MPEKPRTSFGAGPTNDGERRRLDLGKPRYLIRNEASGEVTWIFCPRCAARRNPTGKGYLGGRLWVLAPGATPDDPLPKTLGVIHCDCELGKILRRGAERDGDRFPYVDRYPPDRLIGPNMLRAALGSYILPDGTDAWRDISLAGPFGGIDPEEDLAAGKPLPEPEQMEL